MQDWLKLTEIALCLAFFDRTSSTLGGGTTSGSSAGARPHIWTSYRLSRVCNDESSAEGFCWWACCQVLYWWEYESVLSWMTTVWWCIDENCMKSLFRGGYQECQWHRGYCSSSSYQTFENLGPCSNGAASACHVTVCWSAVTFSNLVEKRHDIALSI